LAEPVTRCFGLGRTLIGTYYVDASLSLCMALAAGPLPLVVALLTIPQLTDGPGIIHGITRTSLIQATVPARLLGRVNASMQVSKEGAMLVGLLAGGTL